MIAIQMKLGFLRLRPSWHRISKAAILILLRQHPAHWAITLTTLSMLPLRQTSLQASSLPRTRIFDSLLRTQDMSKPLSPPPPLFPPPKNFTFEQTFSISADITCLAI